MKELALPQNGWFTVYDLRFLTYDGTISSHSHSANAVLDRLRKNCTKVVVSFQANATTNGVVIARENELKGELTSTSRGFYNALHLNTFHWLSEWFSFGLKCVANARALFSRQKPVILAIKVSQYLSIQLTTYMLAKFSRG